MARSRRPTTALESERSQIIPLPIDRQGEHLSLIPIVDYGVEIAARSSFRIRADRGLIVVKREPLPDGRERVTYRNVAP